MKLQCSDDLQGHAAAVRLVLDQCGEQSKVTCVSDGKGVSLEHEGFTITGVNAICRAIASECRPALLGEKEEGAAEVDQWLNFIHTRFMPVSDAALAELNDWLSTRTFLCGHTIILADFCMYAALSLDMVVLPVAQQSVFCHVLRWYDHMHHAYDAANSSSKSPVCPSATLPLPTAPTPPVTPSPTPAASAKVATGDSRGAGAAAAAAAPAVKTSSAGKKAGKEAGKSGAPVMATGGAAAEKEVAAGKGAKAGDTGAEGDAEKKKAERAAKNAAKNAPAAAAPATPDALSILVGTIVSVKKHPEAEKLYLEEIDVGEDAPRQIISEGAVEPLAVPEGVPNGERVMVEGYDAAAEVQLPPKKKILEALSPDMVTSADGVAGYKGVPFSTSKGPLTSKIGGAPVK